MSIKITVEEALVANASCNNFLNKSFPIKTSFKLAQLKKELSLIEDSFFEARELAIKRYSKKDSDGEVVVEELENGEKFIPLEPEQRDKCAKELKEVLMQTVEIPEIYFSITNFGEDNISAEEIMGLLPFIKD